MAACADDDFYVSERLCEITQCSINVAEILLKQTNNDLMKAVEKFYGDMEDGSVEEDGSVGACGHKEEKLGHDKDGQGDVNGNKIVRKKRYSQLGEVDEMKKQTGDDHHCIVTTRPSLKRSLGRKEVEDTHKLPNNRLKMRQQDMSVKQDKFSQLRQELLAYLEEVKTAGVGEAELMELEDCPACGTPQIVQNKTVRLFQCVEGCPASFCRRCRVHHEPVTCKQWEGGVFRNMDQRDKEIELGECKVSSLYEDHPNSAEYQMVEGEFLRMMADLGKNLMITKIDMVENIKLKEKFEMKKVRFQEENISDKAVLLFHATDDFELETVLVDNFSLPPSGDRINFTEAPWVTKEESSLLMCLVLEGTNIIASHIDYHSIWVEDVDQVLPKYVVHYSTREAPQSSLGWQA